MSFLFFFFFGSTRCPPVLLVGQAFCPALMATLKRTAAVRLPVGFPVSSHTDLAEEVARYFVGELRMTVDAIQVCPGGFVKVSFREESAKAELAARETVSLRGWDCQVVGAGPRVSTVMLHLYPYEGPRDDIESVLSEYREVKDIRFQTWSNLDQVHTGSRIIRMVRTSDIPRNITIGGYDCHIWYKGQPLTCDICGKNHKAADCPIRGKCRRCFQAGHFARDCPNPWGNKSGEWRYAASGDDPTTAEASRPGGTSEAPPPSSSSSARFDPPSRDEAIEVVPPGSSSWADASTDLRDNQLDEFDSQPPSLSQSVLPPCFW